MIQPLNMCSWNFKKGDRTRTLEIRHSNEFGWELSELEDARVVRRIHLSDWHRVERARQTFADEAFTLRAAGWVEI